MPTELKPCPFCGGKAHLVKGNDSSVHHAYVICRRCGVRTNTYYCTAEFPEDAPSDDWNRRVTDAN